MRLRMSDIYINGEKVIEAAPKSPSIGLSLYHLSADLTDLIALRMEMVEAKEDTSEIDRQLAAYMASLPQKVDAVAHVIRHMESQEELATQEIARLNARRRSTASERERLEEYVKGVLAGLPDPKKGKVKKLDGQTASLQLWPNGGAQPVDIQDGSLVPDEYCKATVTLPYVWWLKILADSATLPGPDWTVRREPDDDLIRKALNENCWDCSGSGKHGEDYPDMPCPACGGSGKQGVPGCSLRERGTHLRIK